MDVALDKTRGFERNDPRWHGRIEMAMSVDDVVGLVRDYIATLSPHHFLRLPDVCRGHGGCPGENAGLRSARSAVWGRAQ